MRAWPSVSSPRPSVSVVMSTRVLGWATGAGQATYSASLISATGGVKLASTEGKALDSLKALDAAGVSILVCGTCLQHYKLLDRKQVGETTNMLDIVTSLSLADKVIRP